MTSLRLALKEAHEQYGSVAIDHDYRAWLRWGDVLADDAGYVARANFALNTRHGR